MPRVHCHSERRFGMLTARPSTFARPFGFSQGPEALSNGDPEREPKGSESRRVAKNLSFSTQQLGCRLLRILPKAKMKRDSSSPLNSSGTQKARCARRNDRCDVLARAMTESKSPHVCGRRKHGGPR